MERLSKWLLVLVIVFTVETVSGLPLTNSNKTSNLNATTSTQPVLRTSPISLVSPSPKNDSLIEEEYILTDGVCDGKRRPLIYTENFVLENDKLSQVYASMRIGISGSPNITCVEVTGKSSQLERPKIISGAGNTFVEVGVTPVLGKGFNFSVRLYGSYYSSYDNNNI